MNKQTTIKPPDGLELLRQPFAANQISKLPKETRKQIEDRKNRVQGCMVWKCPECGGMHHKDAVHLDYVGHAALTDRLLDADIEWSWEPLSFDEHGLPLFDSGRGLWIKLTVCGVTRLGYGSADGKQGGDAIKEIIGDALRNAAMRFGAALDLWHKGELHLEGEAEGHSQEDAVSPPPAEYAFPEGPATGITMLKGMVREAWREVKSCGDADQLHCYLETDETKALIAQCEALENPAHREIWTGDGKDNPGLRGIIEQQKMACNNMMAG